MGAKSFGGVSANQRNEEIDDVSFERLSSILHSESGIVLSQNKKSLAVSRLSRRLRILTLDDFSSYCDVLESNAGERREMLSLLTTNVTSFFREKHHFEALKRDLLPDLIARANNGGRVRIWSAGCSSGEEPYSIVLTIAGLCSNFSDLDIRVLATDIDAKVVSTGLEGEYDKDSMPGKFSFGKYVDWPDVQKDRFSFADPIKKAVSFRELNLLSDWPMLGPFDVIFCRNVVIYFDAKTQEGLWARFHDILSPGGTLFVGHSERVSGPANSGFDLVGTTQYVKR